MSFRPVLPLVLAAGALVSLGPRSAVAQPVDPAVVGERLQRLTVAVESLEMALASQKRQIDALTAEVQRLRADQANQGGQRPWVDDLKRLADGIAEVDRKRVADSEQVLKVLSELRKEAAAAAEARRSAPVRAAAETDTRGGGGGGRSREPSAEKAVPYVLEPGQTISEVVDSFNREARKQGYQALTTDQVMKFNNITDARRVPAGATLQLPLIPR